jgi:hypothetical protein
LSTPDEHASIRRNRKLEESSPFGVSILAAAPYLRFVHAISCKRLVGLFARLFALEISEEALDGLFHTARDRLDPRSP